MNIKFRLRWVPKALAVIAGLFSPSPGLVAQGLDSCGGDCVPSALPCNASAEGELAPGDCAQEGRAFDLYEWTPEAAGDAEILVRAAGFTPRLLYSFPPGQFPCRLVKEGDEACAPGDASVRCVRVPFSASGPRRILVTSLEEGGAGSYTLELRCAPRRCEPACQKGAIDCSSTVSGRLEASDCVSAGAGRFHTWKHDFASRTRLRIEVDASAPVKIGLHYDSFMGPAACYQLLEAAPCQKGICADAVVEAGSYRVAVSGPVDTTYRMDLTCEPFDPCAGCPVAGQIACGERKAGQLGPDACALYIAGDSGGVLQRRHRWSFDVAEAGFFEIKTRGTARAAYWSVIKRSDCSPADIAAREPCAGDGSPEVRCEVVRLEPGQYFIEVLSSGNALDAAPVEYSLEVACLDLGLCAACVPQRIECGLPFQGALLPADCVGGDGSFANALLFEVPPPGASDVKFTVSTDGFTPRVSLVDRLCKLMAAGEACAQGGATTACVSATLSPDSWGSKVYLLVSADPSGPAMGSYEVVSECQPFTACSERCVKGAVRVGEDRRGELTDRSCSANGEVFSEAWTLDLGAQTFLDVSVQGEGFTPKVSIRTPDCSTLRGPSPRAVVRMDPGKYTVVVESDGALPGQGGPYTLRVRSRDCNACPPAATLVPAADRKVEGTLGAGDCSDGEGFYFDAYKLEVSAFTEFSLYTNTENPPYFWILREGCDPWLASVLSQSMALSGYLEKGAYTIVVTNVFPNQPVAYSFGFPCKTAAFCREDCLEGTLDCGVPAQGSLGLEDCEGRFNVVDTWRFEVPEGGGDTSVFIGTPPGTTVSFTVFPEDCDREINVRDLCQLIPGGTWSCALLPGPYRLAISYESFRVQQLGPLDYEVTVGSTAGCSQNGGHLPGDCTQDGRIDLEDSICVLAYLFLGQIQGFPCALGTPFDPGPGDIALLDWDGNGRLDITDPILLLSRLFLSGPPHALGETCVQMPACQGTGASCGPR